MFDAICDQCGNRCQIPFAPRSGKPVYCSHCFEQKENEQKNDSRNDQKIVSERPRNSEQLEAINIKLDKIMAVLFQKHETESEVKSLNKTEKSEVLVKDAEKSVEKKVKKPVTKKKQNA